MNATVKLLWFSVLLFITVGNPLNAPAQENSGQLVYHTDSLGHVIMQGYTIDGKREGVWQLYYPTGLLLRIEEYRNGKLDGVVLEIDNKGSISYAYNYKEGQLHGVSRSYGRGGKLNWEKYYTSNKLDGSSRIYYEGGGLQEESWFRNGLRDSVTTWYDTQAHKIAVYQYESGKFNGPSVDYYPNGMVKADGAVPMGRPGWPELAC